ncbi:MAG: hypothetical protein ABR527_04740 [Gemmatimonadota bacterium]
MSRTTPAICALVLALAVAVETRAQATTEPPTATVSIYRVAPGQHLAFLEWIAGQEAVAREAGAPATTWYVHQDGDSWDFLGIAPETSDEIEARIEELQRQRGGKYGFQAGLEFRRHISYHTDTIAWGPTTIDEILAAARE